MSINLYHPSIKETLKYLGWILLFILLWFKGCSTQKDSSELVKVKVPEVKADFETKKPDQKPIILTEKGATIYKEATVYLDNPLNAKLLQENEKLKVEYLKMNDSLKAATYEKAIELNQFSSKFEDENLLLNINGIVRGEVQEITPSYTIKSKEIPAQIKQKETAFRLLGGVELGNNLQLNNFNVKGNLMLQNKKGNIISGSFDTQQNIWIGYNATIFNVKK